MRAGFFFVLLAVATALAPLWAQPESFPEQTAVALPVLRDSVAVYIAWGVDSVAARAEAQRVEKLLDSLQTHVDAPERLRLREQQGAGLLFLDTTAVLVVLPENRVDPQRSPLANALDLREQVLQRQILPSWNEEELLLRLLLGMVYPISLLVVLRLTRLGLRRWEKKWRAALRHWLAQLAVRRGLNAEEIPSKKIIGLLTAGERLVFYGGVILLLSFGWFALFPQTRLLAISLLSQIIAPILMLIGITARSLLLLAYSGAILFVAYRSTRYIAQRRRQNDGPALLADPVIYFPLRVGIWLMALFLVLFPYQGAPRLFAIGLLLLTLLAVLLALRPLSEEIAVGIYLNATYGLKKGMRLVIDGTTYLLVEQGLIHLYLSCGEESHWISYSRLLKAEVRILLEPPSSS